MNNTTHQPFDFQAAPADLRAGKKLIGTQGVLMPLIKQLTEAALQAELTEQLAQKTDNNRRNGYSKKPLKPPMALLN